MHPRTLGPYALQMQRLIILTCVLAAIFITIISGPQLVPLGLSRAELAQWVVYSPNLILPLCAGACALAAMLKAVTSRKHTYMWTDTGCLSSRASTSRFTLRSSSRARSCQP